MPSKLHPPGAYNEAARVHRVYRRRNRLAIRGASSASKTSPDRFHVGQPERISRCHACIPRSAS